MCVNKCVLAFVWAGGRARALGANIPPKLGLHITVRYEIKFSSGGSAYLQEQTPLSVS
jgi:hypothetical protein